MDTQALRSQMNLRVLLEPRGFIRVLEFLFAICAFATTVDFSSSFSFEYTCRNSSSATSINFTVNVAYPFELDHQKLVFCDGDRTIPGNFASDSQFFVATGVLAFLYTLVICAIYVMYESLYENVNMVPLVDFIMTVIFAVFWLSGSAAWANGLSNLKYVTDPANLVDFASFCPKTVATCTAGQALNTSKLTISVLLGFLNFFIWAFNLWFIYKETTWFKPTSPGPTNAI